MQIMMPGQHRWREPRHYLWMIRGRVKALNREYGPIPADAVGLSSPVAYLYVRRGSGSAL